MNFQAEQNVSKFKIKKKLGQGGMGEVWLADDTELHRQVALKFLSVPIQSSDELKVRFKREARIAAQLSHPNIVTLFEVNEYQNMPFIVMEYFAGQSLEGIITRKGLPVAEVIDIVSQICDGLAHAHGKRIVHRDIKPDNILVDSNSHVKITDFGIAKLQGSTLLTQEGMRIGTPNYMSPQQADGEAVDQRSDIFSLGVVLYELLTGQRPFVGDTTATILYAICHKMPQPLSFYKPDLPAKLQDVIDTVLDKDPETRYQTVGELRNALKRIKKQLLSSANQSIVTDGSSFAPTVPVETSLTETPKKESFQFKKIPWKTLGSLVSTLLLSVLLWWLPCGDGQDSNEEIASSIQPKVLVQPTANVAIKVQPGDAQVFIDDVKILSTNLRQLQLSAGDHRIRITRDGYDDLEEIFTLEQGINRPLDYTLTLPEPPQTILTITSFPAKATIFLNGESIGTTPLKYPTITTGKILLRLEKKGYFSLDTTVAVTKDAIYSLPLKEMAIVTINIKPNNATVLIDGKRRSSSQLRNLQLTTGQHTIKISRREYKTLTQTFRLQGGRNLALSFSLQRDAPEGMVLIPAGSFLMGSDDGSSDENLSIRFMSMPFTWTNMK